MAQYAQEEKQIREENLRLQRKLQLEMEHILSSFFKPGIKYD
jgi:hypothetical protein